MMIIGIDVGGTHTDGVLLDGGRVCRTSKVPTHRDALDRSVLAALDGLVSPETAGLVRRIVFSTTLTTNLISQEKYPPTGLILLPGPGLSVGHLQTAARNWVLSGSVDHRGRKVADLNAGELAALTGELDRSGIRDLAIVGKFSTRNPQLEEAVEEYIREHLPAVDNIQLGHRLGTGLNFPRRVQTTWLNTAVFREYANFLTNVRKAVEERGLAANLFLLKADGGTMPLEEGLHFGVETIKSGPAASIMGFLALGSREDRTALLLDIGGSTTDVALMTGGVPLFEPEGVQVGEYLTSVRGLFCHSLPFGGDSPIAVENGRVALLPQRRGPAMIFGGKDPTLTDALAVLGRVEGEHRGTAGKGLGRLAHNLWGGAAKQKTGGESSGENEGLSQHAGVTNVSAGKPHTVPERNAGSPHCHDAPGCSGNGDQCHDDPVQDRDDNAISHGPALCCDNALPQRIDETILYMARSAVQFYCSQLHDAVTALLEEINGRPVYTIHELLEGIRLEPEVLMVVGGPAGALLPSLEEKLGLEAVLPPYHFVANALGAAVARPTLQYSLYADTVQKFYTLTGTGSKQRISGRFSLADARQILLRHTRQSATRIEGFHGGAELVELTREESFHVVRGFSTQGQIMKLEARIKPGIIQPILEERRDSE